MSSPFLIWRAPLGLSLLAALLFLTMACGSSKGAQKDGSVESGAPDTQPDQTQTVEQSVVVDDELAAVEQKPPVERTLRDDLVIVCHAPDKFVDQTELSEEERVLLMTNYISENISTPEAVQLFSDMSVMSLEERQGFFEQKVESFGIKSCPMTLYIVPTEAPSSDSVEDGSGQ